jgi:hypothetical protein
LTTVLTAIKANVGGISELTIRVIGFFRRVATPAYSGESKSSDCGSSEKVAGSIHGGFDTTSDTTQGATLRNIWQLPAKE